MAAAVQAGTENSEECQECKTVLETVLQESPETNFISLDMEISQFSLTESRRTKQIKAQKQNLRKRLIRIISALRNSRGGTVLIHLKDKQRDNDNLGHFDEFIEDELRLLLDADASFVDTFSRRWLKDQHGFILFIVNPSSTVCTADFNTKEATDNSVFPSRAAVVNRLVPADPQPLCEGHIVVDVEHTKDFADFKDNLQNCFKREGFECRSIQLKSFKGKNDGTAIKYIWEDLALPGYISAFAKVVGGGSFFCGIEETTTTEKSFNKPYKTKTVAFEGMDISEQEARGLGIELENKIKNEMLWFPSNSGNRKGYIKITFHQQSEPRLCVLEVHVNYFHGIVFTSREGPEAYKLKDNSNVYTHQYDDLVRLSYKEWFDRLRLIDVIGNCSNAT